MRFGMIGSGSWGTAILKILTDNDQHVNWCVRSEKMLLHIRSRRHNPNYLSSVQFNPGLLSLSLEPQQIFDESDVVIIAVPSAYVQPTLDEITLTTLNSTKVLSAVKGILPQDNKLMNDYLMTKFSFPLENYFTVMGPCHAEEVASEKLSYLTFTGIDETVAGNIADCFKTPYINTVVNTDIYGVQYAAVLKNIYALGAGIAHGLEYGDNFQSVFIANCADEMAGFLRRSGIRNVEVGVHTLPDQLHPKKSPNYAASVYLGDLLVTCYSLFSRNRTFGTMIGKGYSVKTAQLELNMIAEGFNASQCIYILNKELGAEMPIAETVYKILWEKLEAAEGFRIIEETLI